MQANNDMVHRLQDSQAEHKATLEMLTKQISQIVTTLSELHGNNGHIPATVKMPDRANISKTTLRSGRDYAEPTRRMEESSESAEEESPPDHSDLCFLMLNPNIMMMRNVGRKALRRMKERAMPLSARSPIHTEDSPRGRKRTPRII